MRNLGIALIAAAALCVAGTALASGGPPNLCDFNPNLPQCDNGGGGDDNGGGSTNTNTNTNSADGGSVFGSGNSHASGGNASATGGAGGNAHFGVGPVGNNSGNSRNHNSNDSNARVGNVGAFSGVDFEDARFGNSRNSNSVSGEQNQRQGQQQGQIQGQLNNQGQETDQSNAQDTNVDIDASDRSVTRIEAADIPVASAAPVFASACSAGVSGQSMGFGGSLATTNPMCDMALAAEMARAVGNDELAYELTIEAATFARARTNIVRRFGQWIPFVGSLW